jgi:hypothetical protein
VERQDRIWEKLRAIAISKGAIEAIGVFHINLLYLNNSDLYKIRPRQPNEK